MPTVDIEKLLTGWAVSRVACSCGPVQTRADSESTGHRRPADPTGEGIWLGCGRCAEFASLITVGRPGDLELSAMECGYQNGSRVDSVAVARVTTVRDDPDNPISRSGFAARALAAQPQVPAWIAWLFEHVSEQLARMEYQMHYPLDHTGHPDRRTADDWLIIQRVYHAECSARSVERARRFYSDQPGVVHAHAPALPDDGGFYAALAASREWTGRWYSRDPIEAWELSTTQA